MSEYAIGVTAPPFHPWCRGTTAPYFDDMDDIAERWARDPETGKTYTVPGNMTYKQWAAKQTGLAKSVKPLEKSVANSASVDIISSKKAFAKSSKDFPTILLSKQEYAHVMSELATNITKEQKAKLVFSKPIGNYVYTVENNGFGNYRIIGKTVIDVGDLDEIW